MSENRWGSMGGDEDRDYYKTRAELLSDRLEKAEAERDAAIEECRKRKGWDQEIAHWRERAEKAEAELAEAKQDAEDNYLQGIKKGENLHAKYREVCAERDRLKEKINDMHHDIVGLEALRESLEERLKLVAEKICTLQEGKP